MYVEHLIVLMSAVACAAITVVALAIIKILEVAVKAIKRRRGYSTVP